MNYRSKKAAVYDTLRQQILDGVLEPGARLVIDDLANALSVSHIPVREALQQLSADGFVVSRPYQGASVSEIRPESVKELFELIGALELISTRAAMARMDAKDLAQFEEKLEAMDALIGDPEAWAKANVALHSWLTDIGETPLVADAMKRAFVHWDRLRHVYFASVSVGRIPEAQREHWQIFRALQARDDAALEAAVRRHNAAATAAYLQHLEVLPHA